MICLIILLFLSLIAITFWLGYLNIYLNLGVKAVSSQLEIELVFLFLFRKVHSHYSIGKSSLVNFLDFSQDDLASKNKLYSLKKDFLDYISRSADMRSVIEYLHYAELQKAVWTSYLGLEDAAQTGFFTGLLWAFKGLCITLLNKNNKNNISNLQISIYPDFANANFSSQLNCILRIRIAHIILISISLLFAKIRGEYYGYRSEAI